MLKVQIIGHLGQDAILKTFNNVNYVSFSVAHSEKFKDNQGNERETTQWVSCLKRVSEDSKLQTYMKKGTKVYVEGSLSAKIFERQANGKAQVALNCNVSHLELLSSKQDSQTDSEAQQAPLLAEPNPITDQNKIVSPAGEDDLPF
jgi:single-strand DNA-binding protein